MTLLTNLLLLIFASIPLGLANPVPNPIAIPDPSPIGPIQPACTTSVHIDKQTPDVPGPVHGVGGTCTAGTAGTSNPRISLLFIAPNHISGCSISLNKGYSYGVTWGVGASLGVTIAEVLDAGITTGVYYTVTTSTTETVTVQCPDGNGYVCGMAFSASMLQVDGHIVVNATGAVQGEVCNQPSNPHYTVLIPETTGGSAPLPIFHAFACSCSGKSTLPACSFNCDSSSQ